MMNLQGNAATGVRPGQENGGDGPPLAPTRRLLIGGHLVVNGRTFPSLNPATGEILGHAPDATAADAEACVAAARRAFDTTSWATDVDLRVRCLNQLYQALTEHKEELRELTIAEVGAPLMLPLANQLDVPIEIVRFYANLLESYPMTENLSDVEFWGQRHRRWVEKEAAGVVAAIIPYNYPNQIGLAKLAPALAAGCTVVLKGAPDTPLITLALGELIARHTDIPPGVVNVLSSSETAVGEVLTTHPGVDLVTFTGSTATGRRIMEAASRTVKRVLLELGGKSAMVVLDDADVSTAAMVAAFSICSHAGQGCAISTRMVVPREQHDAVAQQVAAMMGQITCGDPADPQVYNGTLDQRAAAGQGGRPGPAGRRGGREAGDRRPEGGSGLLLHAHAAGRGRSGQRDRAGRGLRPGARRDSPRRGRRRGAHRQQLHLRP